MHKPRLASRMAHRDNPPANTAEDYYRVVMYDEFLSFLSLWNDLSAIHLTRSHWDFCMFSQVSVSNALIKSFPVI